MSTRMGKGERELMKIISSSKMHKVKALVSVTASVAAAAMLVRSYMPRELQDHIYERTKILMMSFSSQVTIVIEELDSQGFGRSQLYTAAEMYLSNKVAPFMPSFKVRVPMRAKEMSIFLDGGHEFADTFNGIGLTWRQTTETVKGAATVGKSLQTHSMGERHSSSSGYLRAQRFELSFHKKHKEIVMSSYLPSILEQYRSAQEVKKVRLFTTARDQSFRDSWQSINLNHPATFETLAMDTDAKENLIEDLERFLRRKDHYRNVGKAWKRGYLLYGPPGTGKSSLIAAMANHLKFDIYDLELVSVHGNSDLKRLLMSTGNKSILVVEDIDCSFNLNNGEQDTMLKIKVKESVTLSGLLNFIDGLWSSLGDERIIIFTTNHIDRLDPALLRPGRMDVHIHMSYCTFCGFKTLAANYLKLHDHPLFEVVEDVIKAARVTPAEVSEQLMRSEDTEIALAGLVELLHERKTCQERNADSQIQTTEGESKAASVRSKEIGKMPMLNTTSSSRIVDAGFSLDDLIEFLQSKKEEIKETALEWKKNAKRTS